MLTVGCRLINCAYRDWKIFCQLCVLYPVPSCRLIMLAAVAVITEDTIAAGSDFGNHGDGSCDRLPSEVSFQKYQIAACRAFVVQNSGRDMQERENMVTSRDVSKSRLQLSAVTVYAAQTNTSTAKYWHRSRASASGLLASLFGRAQDLLSQ